MYYLNCKNSGVYSVLYGQNAYGALSMHRTPKLSFYYQITLAIVGSIFPEFSPDMYVAVYGELDSISHKVEQDLFQPHLIDENSLGKAFFF